MQFALYEKQKLHTGEKGSFYVYSVVHCFFNLHGI